MKVLFKIDNNKLHIQNRKKLNSEYKNMLNTNIISNNELVFSDEYIKLNSKIVVSFLNELIKQYHINEIVFQNNEIAELILPIMPQINNITSLFFASNEVFQYSYYEIIKKCRNIKYVSSEFIPSFIFELLDEENIIPESRDEILFTSNFMELNKLNSYACLYYKYIVNLEFPLSNEDIEDFTTFCKINKNLRIININIPNRQNLEVIISILKNYNRKHINIIINSDITDLNLIDYLQKNNKNLQKKYKITFKIKYSKYYIKENIAAETNNRILRACSFLILAIIIMIAGYVIYDNYSSMKEVNNTQERINDYILGIDPTEYIEINEVGENAIENEYIEALKDINSEIVGWLKVNNTNIDYAVTKHNDNDYYLKHNLYNEPSNSGWVFMDYENDASMKDDNTIIYAHNRYTNGVMFGTLNNALKKEWYTNEENLIITFATPYKTYKYRIFSIYVTPVLSDYITTNFEDQNSKINFINKIKNRSIKNFKVDVNENDNILTLSTCYSHNRLVVHAVLINE